MRSENYPDGQKPLSLIEEVRRLQIIETAVDVFAELGYAKTSLARIADRAGISKGVIFYHFAGKAVLMEQLVAHVYERLTDFVVPKVDAAETVVGRIRSLILAVVDFVRTHPTELTALTEVLQNLRDEEGRLRYDDRFDAPVHQGLEAELRAGQKSGELRTFDPRVMAITIQAGVDAMIALWSSDPDHDLEAHAAELGDLFAHAVSAPRSRKGQP